MLCKHCGKSIPNTANTCPYCGKSTKGSFSSGKGISFNFGKFIAMIGSILLFASAFIPVFSWKVSEISFRFDVSDVKKWILVISSVISIVALLVPKIEFLHPVCAVAIGCAFAEPIRFVFDYFKLFDSIRKIIGWEGIMKFVNEFGLHYSVLFLIGYTIMVISAIVILLKLIIGRLISK